uniref:Putative tubby C-terminal-like domain-containing protein n=1 Tax=Helianthus annuus TaxID=4232 RepID=A0A251SVZ6_HELAN
MMDQPSDHAPAPLFPPFSVIGSQFVAPESLEIIVEKYPCRNLVITDTNHKILLKVKPYNKRLHRQRVLLDANDKPIAKLRKKLYGVMLTNKTSNNDGCDLRIKGSWSKGNCTIYMGDSSTVVAQMHKLQTSKYAKDKFTVRIPANMDYACVVTLLAIVDAMENPDEINQASVEVAGGVGEAIGAALTA